MSSKKNDPNIDFIDEFKDVKPLKPNDKVLVQVVGQTLAKQLKRQAIEAAQLENRNYLSMDNVKPIDPYTLFSYKKDGVQEGVFKNLRLAKYKIETTLNLQGLKFVQARKQFFASIEENQKLGIRTMLIRHGIGLHSKPYTAFLKSYVQQWLSQMPEIIAYHSALTQHGGSGATYVLLKKSEQEKANNRELHRLK
ncbi:MAG: DNA-nicking Smr family endonuclease [Paraglaciecola sp.]|jgi:DNA-nicking Smr family endonuclease